MFLLQNKNLELLLDHAMEYSHITMTYSKRLLQINLTYGFGVEMLHIQIKLNCLEVCNIPTYLYQYSCSG